MLAISIQEIWHAAGFTFGAIVIALIFFISLITIREGYLSFRDRNKKHFDKEMDMYISDRNTRNESQAIGSLIVIIFIISLVTYIYFVE